MHNLESEIRKFLASDLPEVLVIKGSWGSGKTTFVETEVSNNKNTKMLNYYSYVSLFNISSIEELRISILANTRRTVSSLPYFKKWFYSFFYKKTHFISKFRNFNFINGLTVAADAFAQTKIEKTIICLDDFERKSKKLESRQLLGLISYLKELKGCKFILIFDEEKLDSEYDEYKEKVIDKEWLFEIDALSAAKKVLSPSLDDHKDVLCEYINNLDVSNIRVIKRIECFVRNLLIDISGKPEFIIRTILQTATLGMASKYIGDSKRIPPFDFIIKWSDIAWHMNKNKTQQQQLWGETLINFEFNSTNELDRIILNAIDTGYYDKNLLGYTIESLEHDKNRQYRIDRFSRAWRAFDNSFNISEEDFVEELLDSFKSVVKDISIADLNATVVLFKELELGNEADQLIDLYIESNKDINNLDISISPWRGDIKDPSVVSRLNAEVLKLRPIKSLVEIFDELSNGHLLPEHYSVLMNTSQEEFKSAFLRTEGQNLRACILACLSAEENEAISEAGARARAALDEIASISKFKALQISRGYPKKS